MKTKAMAMTLAALFLLTMTAGASAWPMPAAVAPHDTGYVEYTANGFKFPMTEVNGQSSPNSATSPWIVADFEGGVTSPAGMVTLTLSAPNPSVSALNPAEREYVDQWLFTLDSSMEPRPLVFGSLTLKAGAMTAPPINLGANQSTKPSTRTGRFDVQMQFAASGGANAHMITEISSLTAGSFLAESSIPFEFGEGYYHTIAVLGNVGSDYNNDEMSVTPEPATLSLLGLGALVLVTRHRKFEKPE